MLSDEEDVVGICGSWGLALFGGGGGGAPFDFSLLLLLELESLRSWRRVKRAIIIAGRGGSREVRDEPASF